MTREQLFPKDVEARMPSFADVASTRLEDLVAEVKFFYPDFGWTWYGIAWDGEDRFFGWVDGDDGELGEFSLTELTALRGKLGCEIERDLSFQPTPIYELAERREERV